MSSKEVIFSEDAVSEGASFAEAENELTVEKIESQIPSETLEEEQETIAFATKFISTVMRLKAVRIDRKKFLQAELLKAGVGIHQVAEAIETTPAEAEISASILEKIARSSIELETRKSTVISFAAGVPGGFAMLATVPSDLLQYYAHIFRIMQKLAYIYGWKDFLGDLDELDDETLSKLALFLGVMTQVSGATTALNKFAQETAKISLQKQIASKALTKTWYYPIVKKSLKYVGVSVTKKSFAQSITKVVPVVGGVIAGGMTYSTLKPQALRLMKHLQALPQAGSLDSLQQDVLIEEEETKTKKLKTKTAGAFGRLKSSVPRVSISMSRSEAQPSEVEGEK